MCKDTSINSTDLNKDSKHSRTLQITKFLMESTLTYFCLGGGGGTNSSGSKVISITSVSTIEHCTYNIIL